MTHKILTGLMAFTLAVSGVAVAQQPLPKHVAGKVVAVSHEKVKVGEQWLDQVKVKVDSCKARGTLEEVVYAPARISDLTALGHLAEQDVQHARTANIETPPQSASINGFGLFWVDDNNRVLRTGLLGHNVDCRLVPQLLQQF